MAAAVPFVAEGFADRRYLPDGSLVPRSRPDAFVEDPDEAVRQAEWLLREKGVQTLCVHGDNPKALAFVSTLRERAGKAGDGGAAVRRSGAPRKDPKDDRLLELAVVVGCNCIASQNHRDFQGVERFGIRLRTG